MKKQVMLSTLCRWPIQNSKSGLHVILYTAFPTNIAVERESFEEKISTEEVARFVTWNLRPLYRLIERRQLNATTEEVLAAREHSRTLSLEETREV